MKKIVVSDDAPKEVKKTLKSKGKKLGSIVITKYEKGTSVQVQNMTALESIVAVHMLADTIGTDLGFSAKEVFDIATPNKD